MWRRSSRTWQTLLHPLRLRHPVPQAPRPRQRTRRTLLLLRLAPPPLLPALLVPLQPPPPMLRTLLRRRPAPLLLLLGLPLRLLPARPTRPPVPLRRRHRTIASTTVT